MPATLKKPTRPEGRPRPMQQRPEGPRGEGSRDAYRRAPSGVDKTGDAGAGSSTMEFVSDFVFIRCCSRLATNFFRGQYTCMLLNFLDIWEKFVSHLNWF